MKPVAQLGLVKNMKPVAQLGLVKNMKPVAQLGLGAAAVAARDWRGAPGPAAKGSRPAKSGVLGAAEPRAGAAAGSRCWLPGRLPATGGMAAAPSQPGLPAARVAHAQGQRQAQPALAATAAALSEARSAPSPDLS
jgi:hypothetical protein